MHGVKSAPVIQMTVSFSNKIVDEGKCISITGELNSLPNNALAICPEYLSIAPPELIPRCWYPYLPMSWIVSNNPDLIICKLIFCY